MPLFSYEAVSADGKKQRGKLEASGKPQALEELKRRGLFVSVIHEEKKTVFERDLRWRRPVKRKHFTVFLRQMSTLIKAGISISESVQIVAQQSESKVLRQTLVQICDDIKSGRQLSDACGRHPDVFDTLYLSMVRAGEASGNMEVVLDRMASFYEKSHYTREKIKSALIYPVTMLVMTIGVTIYLLTSVVPVFVQMFKGLNAELPQITQTVMKISDSLLHTWYLYVLAIFSVYAGYVIMARTDQGRYWLDYARLRIPIFGTLLQKGAIARLSRTMSTLFSSSVPILEALTIVEHVADNKVIGRALAKSSDSLREGRPLSEPLKKEWMFPPLVSNMIAIGEETGALDTMLEKIAEFYEAEVENTVDRLKALVEPVMIVILSFIIGGIVLSIMVPMFDIFNKIQ